MPAQLGILRTYQPSPSLKNDVLTPSLKPIDPLTSGQSATEAHRDRKRLTKVIVEDITSLAIARQYTLTTRGVDIPVVRPVNRLSMSLEKLLAGPIHKRTGNALRPTDANPISEGRVSPAGSQMSQTHLLLPFERKPFLNHLATDPLAEPEIVIRLVVRHVRSLLRSPVPRLVAQVRCIGFVLVLDRQRAVLVHLQRQAVDIIPVAPVDEIRLSGLLVNLERRINGVGVLVRCDLGTFAGTGVDQRAVVCPLLFEVRRGGISNGAILATGLADGVEAVESPFVFGDGGSPGMIVVLFVNHAGFTQYSTHFCPWSRDARSLPVGDVEASSE